MTLSFLLPHIAFTGLLIVALLMYALVKFRRRHPSLPIELEYTEEEKESFQKAGDKEVSVLQMIPLMKAEYEAAKTDHAHEWLLNFLPADAESMTRFLQERLKGI